MAIVTKVLQKFDFVSRPPELKSPVLNLKQVICRFFKNQRKITSFLPGTEKKRIQYAFLKMSLRKLSIFFIETDAVFINEISLLIEIYIWDTTNTYFILMATNLPACNLFLV